jgi:hypothetical protein
MSYSVPVKEGTFYIIYVEYGNLPLEISRLYKYFFSPCRTCLPFETSGLYRHF